MNTSVTLKTGRVISLADISLDVSSQTFRYGVADVSYALTREQMRTFPGFNEARANAALSDAVRGTGPVGSTSTISNFVSGLGEDVSSIGFGVRDFVTGKDGTTSDLRKVIYVVVIFGVLWFVWQISKTWKR